MLNNGVFHIREQQDFVASTIAMQLSVLNMVGEMNFSNEISYRYGCGIIYEVEETLEQYLHRVGDLDIKEGEPEW